MSRNGVPAGHKRRRGIERKGQKEKEQQFVQITSDPCSSSPDVPHTYILRKGLLRGSRQQWRREGRKVFAALTHQPSSGQKTGGGRGWLVGRFLLWVSNNGSGENFGVFPLLLLLHHKRCGLRMTMTQRRRDEIEQMCRRKSGGCACPGFFPPSTSDAAAAARLEKIFSGLLLLL